jgi:hypothetical protein
MGEATRVGNGEKVFEVAQLHGGHYHPRCWTSSADIIGHDE